MDGAADSFASSSSRPLRLRMRSDLVVKRQSYQARDYWVVKDPLTLKYYRFEEEEFALLEMLDGSSSLDRIKTRFDRQFAPQQISLVELHQFIGMLYRSSLLVSDAAGQGEQLLTRQRQTSRKQRVATLTNILAIRFKGFDPDRILNWLNRRVGWFYSLPAFCLCALLAICALLLVTVQFDVFRTRLPSFNEFFAFQNWIWLALTLAGTKVLHEFGHGLSCKRFGGECHEMGVMLLVLTPCLYCNVSDSWMLPSKWRRAAIGAAGMYVEIVLASICTFLWWFSEPGMLNYMCLNVMFVCSVTTLLFNANPLLRYDGYYILSDLVEIPNLRQKSTSILRRKMGAWLLGLPEPYDPFLPSRRQWMFAAYSVAAAAYRWVVVLSIFLFLYKMFEPYGLKIVGQLIAMMALYGLLIQPLVQLCKFFAVPGRIERVKKPRMAISITAVSVVVLGVALIPLPHYVSCSLYMQPRGAAAVYVDVPGTLTEVHVQPGDRVEAGRAIVTLKNVDVQFAITELEGKLREEQARLVSLQQLEVIGDESAPLEIETALKSIASLDEQVAHRRQDAARLSINSPASGTIVAPPSIPKSSDDDGQLPTWTGTPLQTKNQGAHLQDGVLVCQVGNPRQLEAVMVIDQSDIEFVREGQDVEIFLEQLPGRKFTSRVGHVSLVEMKYSPRSLSSKSGGNVDTRTDSSGRERPASASYQVSAPLDDASGLLLNGVSGQAKIRVGSQTLGQRAWRYFFKTFNFEL